MEEYILPFWTFLAQKHKSSDLWRSIMDPNVMRKVRLLKSKVTNLTIPIFDQLWSRTGRWCDHGAWRDDHIWTGGTRRRFFGAAATLTRSGFLPTNKWDYIVKNSLSPEMWWDTPWTNESPAMSFMKRPTVAAELLTTFPPEAVDSERDWTWCWERNKQITLTFLGQKYAIER